jgi:hypothetical protein
MDNLESAICDVKEEIGALQSQRKALDQSH